MPTPTRWTPELILEEEDPFEAFAEYVQQQLGVPWPTIKDKTILRRKIKEFFAATPQADWGTLCRTVQYCKSRKIRFQRIWMPLESVREAYSRGYLPELGSTEQDASLEEQIKQALEQEERPDWRARLLGARTSKARELALREWRESCS